MSTTLDLAIVGGGPSGLAAATYAIHANLSFALVSPDLGGKVSYPFALRDVPRYDTVWGAGLVREFADHTSAYLAGAPDAHVKSTVGRITRDEAGVFQLTPANGATLRSRTVIFCAGVRAQRLFVDGETMYWGKGLSFSALSHAPQLKGKDVAVIAGGDRAIVATTILKRFAGHIYYIAHRPQRMENQELSVKALDDPAITVFRDWEVQQILGDEYVSGIALVGMNGEVRTLPVEGVFVQFGLLPNNDAVRELVEIDEQGHIIVDESCRTSIPGFYAAGDVTNVHAEQVTVSIGEGAKAALSAWEYLSSLAYR
jgi:thioredoxin reductase